MTSHATLPLQNTIRRTASRSDTNGSSRISSNDPLVSSSIGDLVCFIRSPTLGAKMIERGVPLAVDLPAQHVEVLGRRGRVAHLNVVLGRGREEALDPRRRVLRSLALVAVGQEQHEPVVLTPLVLGRADVLVEDDLGAVDEVTELRLPDHQRVRIGLGIAVLEPERGELGQEQVVDPERPLGAFEVFEGDPRLAGVVVGERGVPLAERAPAGVLAGQPHVVALEQQRPDGGASAVAQSTSPSA